MFNCYLLQLFLIEQKIIIINIRKIHKSLKTIDANLFLLFVCFEKCLKCHFKNVTICEITEEVTTKGTAKSRKTLLLVQFK